MNIFKNQKTELNLYGKLLSNPGCTTKNYFKVTSGDIDEALLSGCFVDIDVKSNNLHCGPDSDPEDTALAVKYRMRISKVASAVRKLAKNECCELIQSMNVSKFYVSYAKAKHLKYKVMLTFVVGEVQYVIAFESVYVDNCKLNVRLNKIMYYRCNFEGCINERSKEGLTCFYPTYSPTECNRCEFEQLVNCQHVIKCIDAGLPELDDYSYKSEEYIREILHRLLIFINACEFR